MNKLDKIGKGNAAPATKENKLIVAEDLNKVIDTVNTGIDVNITNETTLNTGLTPIKTMVPITQADYDSLPSYDDSIYYVIISA